MVKGYWNYTEEKLTRAAESIAKYEGSTAEKVLNKMLDEDYYNTISAKKDADWAEDIKQVNAMCPTLTRQHVIKSMLQEEDSFWNNARKDIDKCAEKIAEAYGTDKRDVLTNLMDNKYIDSLSAKGGDFLENLKLVDLLPDVTRVNVITDMLARG